MENSTDTTAAAAAPLPDPAAPAKYKGRPFDLAGKTYIVPALSLGSAIKLQPQLQSIQEKSAGMTTADWISSVLDIILPAFRRNYPDASREELEDLLDLDNLGDLLRAAMGRDKPGEEVTQ